MTKIESGILTHGSKLSWPMKDVFRKWIGILRCSTYTKIKDAPWWYTERASLSQIAGAIWLSEGYVLEEYSNQKYDCKRRGRWSKKKGRVDMYFNFGVDEYVVEAKQMWPKLDSKKMKNMVEKTKICLKRALNDARDIVRERGNKRLGVLFICPQINRRNKYNINDLLKEYVDSVICLAKVNKAAVAWCFPPEKRTKLNDKNKYYPGQIVIMRLVKQ